MEKDYYAENPQRGFGEAHIDFLAGKAETTSQTLEINRKVNQLT